VFKPSRLGDELIEDWPNQLQTLPPLRPPHVHPMLLPGLPRFSLLFHFSVLLSTQTEEQMNEVLLGMRLAKYTTPTYQMYLSTDTDVMKVKLSDLFVRVGEGQFLNINIL